MKAIPKEHGGTVMAAGALLAGWGVAGGVGPAVGGMILAAAGLLLIREPLVLLLRRRASLPAATRRSARRHVLASGLLLGAGGGIALWTLPAADLGLLAGVGLPLFAAAILASLARRDRTLLAEAAGVGAVALIAPALYLAAAGRLDAEAWKLYTACLLFFLGAMLHLRTLLRDRKAARHGAKVNPERAGLWSAGTVGAGGVLFAAGWLPLGFLAALALAALRPLVMRGAVLARPQRVGLVETALTAAFVAAIVLLAG